MNASGAQPESMNFRLRPLESGDADLYRALYTSPAVMAHLGGPLAPAAADACFRTLMARDDGASRHYAVLHDDGIACGLGAIMPVPAEAGAAELGLMLLPDHWHRGLGTAVLRELAEIAFANSTCQCLRVQYGQGNVLFERLAIRVGFEPARPEGDEREISGRNRTAWLARPERSQQRQQTAGERPCTT
jgi:RimJ/RimL family protein N-acetyltransferase